MRHGPTPASPLLLQHAQHPIHRAPHTTPHTSWLARPSDSPFVMEAPRGTSESRWKRSCGESWCYCTAAGVTMYCTGLLWLKSKCLELSSKREGKWEGMERNERQPSTKGLKRGQRCGGRAAAQKAARAALRRALTAPCLSRRRCAALAARRLCSWRRGAARARAPARCCC